MLRLRAREYRISRIQDDIFARRSSASFLLLLLLLHRRVFFPTLFLQLTKFRAAADPFCRRGQIEISDDYSVVMYSSM